MGYGFQTYRYSYAPGEVRKITTEGNYIRGMAADSPYLVRLDDVAPSKFQTGVSYRSPVLFTRVEITNTSDEAQVIEVVVAKGEVGDNRLVGQMDISGGIRLAANRVANFFSFPANTTAAELVPENLARSSLLIQNLSASDGLWVGDANVTVDGIQVSPGGSINLTTTARIVCRSVSGVVDVRVLEEEL